MKIYNNHANKAIQYHGMKAAWHIKQWEYCSTESKLGEVGSYTAIKQCHTCEGVDELYHMVLSGLTFGASTSVPCGTM